MMTELPMNLNMSEVMNSTTVVTDWNEHSLNLTNLTWPSECETFVMEYGIISGSVCAVAFIVGVLYCVLGYRLFKATMFASGFVFGSEIVYFVCVEENVLPLGGKIGVSVGAGLLCGLTAMFFHYVGLFVTGFQLGLVLTVSGLIIVEQFYHPFTKWIPIGLILGVAVICALMALRWQKGITILSTCALGAALILVAVDYFLDSSRIARYSHDRLTAQYSRHVICWYSWLIVGFWPLLASFGAVIQWCCTGAKFDHRRPQAAQNVPSMKSPRQARVAMPEDSESLHTHYRQLYQIRRVNGDVVSRSYIQTVQSQASQSQRLLSQGGPDGMTDDTIPALTSIADVDA